MKKLMMVAAIALAAVSANAASFIWKTGNYTNVLNPDGSAVTTAAGYTSLMNGGNIVLVLLSDGTYGGTMTALTGTSGDTAAFKATGGATIKYGLNTVFGFDGDGSLLKNGDKIGVAYQSATGELSQLILTDTTGADLGKLDSVYTVSGLSDDSWAGEAFTFTTAGTSSAKTYITIASAPVPEPTSGLLMLLGMAGLALRRRRA
jgi:hypothetical protein